MRRALTYILVGTAAITVSAAAERQSWTKLHYLGGTVPIRTSPYDYNTRLTVTRNPEWIEIAIAPASIFAAQQTIRIKPSQVLSLSIGPAAWRHVAEVPGARLPAKHPTLFGVLSDSALLGIIYDAGDGKREAILLENRFAWQIVPALKELTGKTPEYSP